jgi:hypothetical protein
MDTPNLKFFQVVVADNRNYACIRNTNFVIEKQELDYNEIHLLKKWFASYCRNAYISPDVLLATTDNDTLYLTTQEYEVYGCPESLEERVQELHQIEADFFAKVVEIKQPKF